MVGAGWVSRYHLRAWARLADRARVVAIADPDSASLNERANEFDIAARYVTGEELVASEKLDAIDICTPREFHAPLIHLMAARGLPTICQKPLATDLSEARRLAADVAGRIPFMVHENWRHRRYYRRISEWLRDGVAGDIRQVHLEFLSSGMIPDASGERPALVRQPFLRSLDRLLVMEILIHHLDTLRFLLGEMVVRFAALSRSNEEIVGEDAAVIALSLQDGGAPVVVTGNLAVHGAPPAPSDHLRIVGSAGTLALQGNCLTLAGRTCATETFDLVETYQAAYDSTIAHFLDELGGGRHFETGFADNLNTLELVEAAYAAAG
jgi:predicted dehydrogenase